MPLVVVVEAKLPESWGGFDAVGADPKLNPPDVVEAGAAAAAVVVVVVVVTADPNLRVDVAAVD